MKDCDEPLLEEGPEPGSRWGMVFDGAVNQYGNGIGIKDEKPWYYDIKFFLQSQIYLPGASLKDKKTLRRLADNFYLNGDMLHKRNFDMVFLRCVDRHKADLLMTEVHEGSFGTHSNGHAMAKKML
ncbi:hypothetical protein KIW84_062974 [Lathyrus oleraceus]|uniref:Uncharacterized protein n=1 Tax=Pisum sativum TaxID=3888 RepID=A0A9D4WA99_PEA|nr:hypothetical protein KIW84_062974 [Pisum sativum]